MLKLKDDIRGKDEAINALTVTLLERGEHNKKLFEQLTEFKNHFLSNQILGQKFLVQKIGSLKNEDVIVS